MTRAIFAGVPASSTPVFALGAILGRLVGS
jgi:H+/gluconate symporter-like permease